MKKTLLILLGLTCSLGYAQTISLQQISTTFSSPIEMANAGDSRMFVVERAGVIKIVNSDGTVNATPFLDISGIVLSGGERGLLGLAFHPQYATNGYFYVYYNASATVTRVARYSRSTTDTNVANPSSALTILNMNQPNANHNGGCLRFGPDGYLYIGKGDGGGAGDTSNNAQNVNSLLGKILRIDINNGSPYSSPATNAFPGAIAGADEIWATGMRNPWKFSFDTVTGDLWIADVGQNAVEEINKVAAGTPAGLNFGWRCYEGNNVYNSAGCGPASNYTPPFAQYLHSFNNGCSITGGYVYRGTAYPNLVGKYFFADYCNNRIGYVSDNGAITWGAVEDGNRFTTFGQDNNGELYVMGITSGKLYRITDTAAGTDDFNRNAFSVYPNPSKGFVNIKSDGSMMAVNAALFDLAGKQVSSVDLQPSELNMIQTSHLPSGFYVMNITDSSGAVHARKLTVE